MTKTTKKVTSSPLSHFVVNTPSSEKKKIYRRVIVAAAQSQLSTLQRAKEVA